MSEPVQPPDPTRRRFFRQVARDAVTSVGSVLGAAQSLQETSAEAARGLLGGSPGAASPPAGGPRGSVVVDGPGPDAARATGWRAPFRWDGDVCRIVDQRRLPDLLVDLELRGAADTVGAINDGALVGTVVQAQVAAVTVALVAARTVTSRPFARRATVRGAANALRLSRPGSAPMAAALARMTAPLEGAGLQLSGEEILARLRDEAARIIDEAVDDHGALVGHLVAALPGPSDAPLRVLVAGSTGAMGGGQFGTALSAVQTIHHAGRPIHALVAEGRPLFEGSRIAAWELRQAGVAHALVTDAAAPGCILAGDVDAVLVGADRIAANGDVVAPAGASGLALACAASGTPLIVCATTNAVDLAVPGGPEALVENGRPGGVLRAAGTRVAPDGTQARNPLQERVPAALVTLLATEEGVLRAPFAAALAAAVERATVRRSASPGFAALVAQRASAADPRPGGDAIDVAALRAGPGEAGA